MEYYLNAHTHLDRLGNGSLASTSPSARELRIISIDIAKEQIPQTATSREFAISSFPRERYSVGLHPWSVSRESYQQHLAEVARWAKAPNVAAVGECGLDKLCPTPLCLQTEVFLWHIALAANVGKPMILHLVKATDELLAARQEAEKALHSGSSGTLPPMVIHGFRGKREQACQLLDKGFYLSFGKYYNAEALRLAYESGRMLLETDTNEESIVSHYANIAALLHIEHLRLTREQLRLGEKLFNLSIALQDPI